MPFPFLPGGAIVAAAVLFSAIAAFVAAMMAMDKAATRVFGGVVSGVVAGARRWGRNEAPWSGRRSAELRPITTAMLETLERPRASQPPADTDGDDGSTAASSELADDGVEPLDTLDRVRPRDR
jgi:hypothetical protein